MALERHKQKISREKQQISVKLIIIRMKYTHLYTHIKIDKDVPIGISDLMIEHIRF